LESVYRTLRTAALIRRALDMKTWERFIYGLNRWLLSSIAAVLTVVQIILCILLPSQAGLHGLRYIGYVIWGIGALFGIMPIFTLRRKGGVAKGESYMRTTVLVDSGIYAVVRHPQGGVAWVLMNLALILIGQTWLIVILGIASIVLVYLDALKADQYAIEKFGDDYKRYMERVPRINFLAGIMRLLQRRRKG
jgi:protein-S-isoprenylcysteine O-methyltransferase Ste14